MSDIPVPGSKRRRLRGSCNFCKQRKSGSPVLLIDFPLTKRQSDSSQMPGNRCSNCISFNLECTHDSSKAGPSKKESPADSPTSQPPSSEASTPSSSKTAQEHVAAIVVQATSYIKDDDVRRVLLDVARYARGLENQLSDRRSSSPSSQSHRSSPPSHASSPPQLHIKEETDELYVDGLLSERFDRFRLDSDATRYYGKSSHFELINTAIDIRENLVEPATTAAPKKREEFWLSPWEHEHLLQEDPPKTHHFPEPDLLESLVRIFFTRVNVIITLLHRPTFERLLAAGLHFTDHHFGETVLGVCAVASKFSDDPRVILPGTNTRLSSGWQYYKQIKPYQKSSLHSISLHQAQTLCLCVIYIQGGSTPDMCWGLGGAGIRYAQEVGVHRKGRYENDPVLAEQWKRVFWMLLCIDTLVSSFVGRPRATRSYDYDLDYPADCDDEYWETDDPELAFKQPAGRPSSSSYMVAYLKLMEILGMAQETIYLVNLKDKSKEWVQDAVASVDSALNDWADKIPDHLRWDPNNEDPVFATQSAVLYAAYYHVQIQVHRIFIIAPGANCADPEWRESQITNSLAYNYPSLAICASSARACSHVMDVASRRGLLCNPHVLNAVFDAGIILLLNVWGGRKVGLNVDPKKCLQDIDICLRVFRVYETRWQVAGRQHDIINELMSAANMDVYAYAPNPLKRIRDVDVDGERQHEVSNSNSPASSAADSITTPNEVHMTLPGHPIHYNTEYSSDQEAPQFGDFSLPVSSHDLGRMPLYEPFQVDWDVTVTENLWGKQQQTNAYDMGVQQQQQQQQMWSPPTYMEQPQHHMQHMPQHQHQHHRDSSLLSNPGLPAEGLELLHGAPTAGYDWDQWGKYISSIEEFMTTLDGPPNPPLPNHYSHPSYSNANYAVAG
ncbi:Fungal-trans domain-containing protein [Mycena indigotica]|uniref:Fungal-trans domain-containing protein n=1 Tax=Mycena indigotica TaxID=2126181 RepID=A0A8H6RYZ4_9AGAR|nr:Fungal-trans domain-containing protein [Mycena indigotica]KAF7289170.1 Fungal-trans domain-containing protein [Mycena indigotica]